jgi:hypothetical protein
MVMRRGNGRAFWFFVYLIFGLYLLNVALNFISLPTSANFITINKWIIFVGGGLLIFSAIRHLLTRRYGYY